MRFPGANSILPAFCLAAAALSPVCAAAATVTTLYRFHGGADGDQPVGPLIADRHGNLYGSTYGGGAKGFGVIFRLAPPAGRGGRWTQTVLYDFTNPRKGVDVNPPLILNQKGDLFGTTFDGGTCFYYCGVAFKLSPSATQTAPWHYTVLFRFGGPVAASGGAPVGSLISDGAGGYVGATQFGGSQTCAAIGYPCGTVFQIKPPASQGSGWSQSVLYSFRGIPDGAYPSGPVVADAQGSLYGATSIGGTGRCSDGEGTIIGCGTIFQLRQSGAHWTEAPIYQFKAGEFNNPSGPLVFATDGALYGAATYDIFRVVPPEKQGQAWRKQVVYQFEDGIAGTIPYNPVVGDDGDLYGTTVSSGLSGFSTAYKLSPPAAGTLPWKREILARFGHGLSSEQPSGTVLPGRDGVLYGTLADRSGSQGHGHGQVFAITP